MTLELFLLVKIMNETNLPYSIVRFNSTFLFLSINLTPSVTGCTNVDSYFNLIYWDQIEILQRLVTQCTAEHQRPIYENQNIAVIALHSSVHII